MKKNYTIIIALLITFKVFAQPTISLSSFSTGYTLLSDIANCGDSRLFITQQKGKIIICDSLGVKRTTPFIDLASIVHQGGGERGLLGLAFHPNYKQNGYFYVNYTRIGDGATRISRFSVNPADSNLALPSSELNLLTITQPSSNHNGGNIEFGPDGFLYIGMGDGGGAGDLSNNSQNKLLRLGKMLRIDVNGTQPYSVPTSNPFVGNAAYAPEIWSLGLRNPWKWSFDRITGDMWIGDVGQGDIEEIDFQLANSAGGENYGWRCYEGSTPYNTSGCLSASNYDFPIFEYNHNSTSTTSCSVTGGYLYRGATHQSLFGYYLLADYCSGRFWWVKREANGTFTNGIFTGVTTGNYVSFGENYLGDMFVATGSVISRINAPNPCPVAFINSNDSVSYCQGAAARLVALRANGLSYQWSLNGAALTGATNYWIDANQPGNYSITVTNSANCSNTSTNVSVEELPLPVASINQSGNALLCPGDTITIVASGGVNYQWQNNATNDTLFVTSSGQYSASVIAENGCISQTDTLVVSLYPDPNLLLSGYQQSYVAPLPTDIIVSNLTTTQIFINGVENNVISGSTVIDGNNIISGIYTDINGCTWSFIDTIFVDLTVNLKNQVNQQFSIIPNPVLKGNSFTINGNFKSIEALQFFDVTGKQIEVKNNNSTLKSFSTAGLNAGIYTIKFIAENNFYSKQLMIIE